MKFNGILLINIHNCFFSGSYDKYNIINFKNKMNKKQLYESIMKDVSKTIKKHLNEATYNNPEKDE